MDHLSGRVAVQRFFLGDGERTKRWIELRFEDGDDVVAVMRSM